jgi:hypothetical protein
MRLQWKRLRRNWPFFGERRQLLLSQKKIPQQYILHYLYDFIFALPVPETTPAKIRAIDKAYDEVMPWAFPERIKKTQQEHVSRFLGLRSTQSK